MCLHNLNRCHLERSTLGALRVWRGKRGEWICFLSLLGWAVPSNPTA
jgi:hypothetical protein